MFKFIEEYKQLPKEIYILSVATLINRTGDFVVPFLALYLSQKLNLSLPVTGVIVSISGFIKIPGSYLGGKLNDHFNSKYVFVFSEFVSALILTICGFVKKPEIAVPLLILFSFTTSMVKPPTTAMISDLLPPHQRKLGYIVRYIGINIGVAIGLSIAGFLYNYNTTIMFLGDAITMFLGVILVFFGIKVSNLKDKRASTIGKNEVAEIGNIISILKKRIPLFLYMIFCSIMLIVFEQTKFALPLTMNERFHTDGPVLFGFLISTNAITATVLALFHNKLFSKVSHLTQIIIGGILFSLGFGCYAFTTSYQSFVLATILWSIGEVFIFTNSTVFIVNNAPENFRGRLSSVFSIILTTIGTLGIILTERSIEIVGIYNSWIVLSVITLTSAAVLIGLKIKYFNN
ncbi:MAG: MFS transporter, partial [Spirochaetales bacterium]|nr:MFS transporter [Spirochaetales bacterium]